MLQCDFCQSKRKKALNPEQTGIETTTIDYPACFQINSAKNNSRFLAEPAA